VPVAALSASFDPSATPLLVRLFRSRDFDFDVVEASIAARASTTAAAEPL
jgi:hypothetical protein